MFRFQTGSIKSSTLVFFISSGTLFRFQTGSIKSIEIGECSRFAHNRFRFQTGSIKRVASKLFQCFKPEFRFQTGSIKRSNETKKMRLRWRFDSKLVRLKVAFIFSFLTTSTFRFQTGSIKREKKRGMHILKSAFRFQTGSIKRQIR